MLSYIFLQTLRFTNLNYSKHGGKKIKWLQAVRIGLFLCTISQEEGHTSENLKLFILLAKATMENQT